MEQSEKRFKPGTVLRVVDAGIGAKGCNNAVVIVIEDGIESSCGLDLSNSVFNAVVVKAAKVDYIAKIGQIWGLSEHGDYEILGEDGEYYPKEINLEFVNFMLETKTKKEMNEVIKPEVDRRNIKPVEVKVEVSDSNKTYELNKEIEIDVVYNLIEYFEDLKKRILHLEAVYEIVNKPKEMTLEEIEKALGHKINIKE